MGFQMPLTAMKQFLEQADVGQKGKDRLNHYALIPCAFLTEFEILWDPVLAAESKVAQCDGSSFVLLNEG